MNTDYEIVLLLLFILILIIILTYTVCGFMSNNESIQKEGFINDEYCLKERLALDECNSQYKNYGSNISKPLIGPIVHEERLIKPVLPPKPRPPIPQKTEMNSETLHNEQMALESLLNIYRARVSDYLDMYQSKLKNYGQLLENIAPSKQLKLQFPEHITNELNKIYDEMTLEIEKEKNKLSKQIDVLYSDIQIKIKTHSLDPALMNQDQQTQHEIFVRNINDEINMITNETFHELKNMNYNFRF